MLMSCCKNKNQGCGNKVVSKPDFLVCTCMGVMQSDIQDAIKNGAKSFESLSESLGVGTGCSSCVAQVEEILKEEMSSEYCKS